MTPRGAFDEIYLESPGLFDAVRPQPHLWAIPRLGPFSSQVISNTEEERYMSLNLFVSNFDKTLQVQTQVSKIRTSAES